MNILILSDSHGYYDEKILRYCSESDEIWHAGDIGTVECAQKMTADRVFRAVHGNIDGQALRSMYPEYQYFEIGTVKILILHIAFQGKKMNDNCEKLYHKYMPDVLVYGHSHIAKIWRPKSFEGLLAINPGAIGKHGFHQHRTCCRLTISDNKLSALEMIEFGTRG